MSAERAKRMPRAMVAWKSVRSSPRRVWKPDEKLSAPKAPPKLEPVRCKSTAMMSRAESAICTYGSIPWRKTIPAIVAGGASSVKRGAREPVLREHRTYQRKFGNLCCCMTLQKLRDVLATPVRLAGSKREAAGRMSRSAASEVISGRFLAMTRRIYARQP